ncbi:MAG: hypothetical protein MI924_36800 [Chloroflexales bacterium]|nr:hypothetical protein [Chloroflexales bacterium]
MEITRLLPLFIQGTASTTFFTSRPFLTVFGFALFARLGLSISGADAVARFAPAGIELASYGGLAATPWLLGDTVLMILGLLALFELGAASSDDLRFWYNQSLWLVQPGSAFVVTYTFADTEVTLFLEFLASLLPVTPVTVAALGSDVGTAGFSPAAPLDAALVWLGHILTVVWAGLLAAIAWVLGRVRTAVAEIIEEIDEDNTLGLQTLMHWTETGWTAIGTLIMFVLPSLALIMAGITIATLFFIRRYFEHRERRIYIACANCATPTHPSAPFCPACHLAREEVRQVGLFGQARDTPVVEPTTHRLQLMARKRCPSCASRLHAKAVQQSCESCGTTTFGDISGANSFIRMLDAKLTRTTLITFVLGLIPLAGLVPAMVYYRLSLISSLRSYLPRSIGCLTRWGVRVLNIFLIMLQSIPGIGMLAMPLMCLTNYGIYRQVFTSSAQGTLGSAAVAQAVDCPGCGAPGQGARRFCTQCGRQLQTM